MSEQDKGEAATEAAKKTREQRVTFETVGGVRKVHFKMPGGKVVTRAVADLPEATRTHALEYGIRRVFQDGLSGRIKDGESADDVADDLIARFDSGDWAGRRGGGDGKQTIDAFARSLAKNSLGKDADKDAVNAKVAEYRANPKAWAIVERRYAEAFASLDDELA